MSKTLKLAAIAGVLAFVAACQNSAPAADTTVTTTEAPAITPDPVTSKY